MTARKTIRVLMKTVFYSSLFFLGVAAFSLTIGQAIPVEFKSWNLMQEYYNIIFGGTPVAVLLTLSGTIRKSHMAGVNIGIVVLTATAAILSFVILVHLMFTIGFGAWETTSVLFRHKKNAHITISEQRHDMGVFGYGGSRTVRLKPFLAFWQAVSRVDTASLDKTEWLVMGSGEE